MYLLHYGSIVMDIRAHYTIIRFGLITMLWLVLKFKTISTLHK